MLLFQYINGKDNEICSFSVVMNISQTTGEQTVVEPFSRNLPIPESHSLSVETRLLCVRNNTTPKKSIKQQINTQKEKADNAVCVYKNSYKYTDIQICILFSTRI